MPLYEYVCRDCGTRFDALRSMKDADSPIHCHSCMGEHTTRALSVFYSSGGERRSSEVSQGGGGCGSCRGGSCSSCGH